MEPTFKVGDLVRCRNAVGDKGLEYGANYVVTRVGSDGTLDVYSDDPHMINFYGMAPKRFELYDPAVYGPAPVWVTPAIDAFADKVYRPNHYARFEIEPIEFIMRNKLEFWQGNVVKYTLRYDAKDGIEDLKKARRYLDMQIKKMEGNMEFAK